MPLLSLLKRTEGIFGVRLLGVMVKAQTDCVLLYLYTWVWADPSCSLPEQQAEAAAKLQPPATSSLPLPGVSRAAELGQPRAGHRSRPQRPPPHRPSAASRQPGGAEPHAPHPAGRARAGAAAVPEAQGNAWRCYLE